MKLFDQVRNNRIKRNAFDLSHDAKFSMQLGTLTPILLQEVVPGDSFRCNTESLIRFAPMLAPVMHRVDVFTHTFFVPSRLLWSDFQDFVTGGEDGMSEPVHPYFKMNKTQATSYPGAFQNGSLLDFLGVPTVADPLTDFGDNDTPVNISALPLRAYQLVYNEYYRDQNLIDKVPLSKSSGLISNAEFAEISQLRKRCWEKDYFTSALPFAQKGEPVRIPFAGQAPVVSYYDEHNPAPEWIPDGGLPPTTGTARLVATDDDTYYFENQNQPNIPLRYDPKGSLRADLSQVTATTINDLRKANQLQKWLERNARSGSRYIESILAHFGVVSSDARLQRPEYLGGGKTPVVISEVLQQSSTDNTSPQGNMAGHGLAVGNTHSFKRYFEEHGYIISIMSIIPRTSYQQGLPRLFTKFNKFDLYWPEFAHLGEQEVKFKELYCSHGHETDYSEEDTFGYQSRYAEYKYNPSRVHGRFKDNMSYWHMGRIFENQPRLNADFVTANPTKRIFAVTDEDVETVYVQLYHNIQAIRPMPVFGTPSL